MYLFITGIVTCIYIHNIIINIMVINNRICRASVAYNVNLYKVIADKTYTVCQGGNITNINMYFSQTTPYTQNSGGGPRVVVSTAAFHASVRGSVPGLGGLKETNNVSSPSTWESQYCGEPP